MNAEERKKIRERVARCHMMGQELGPDLTVGEWTSLLDDVDRLEARVKELSNPATWRATINRLESAELEALAELDERIAENSALKARVEKLEEVRKAATLNVEKMERITDIDWTETDEYWALRAALDRAGEP